MEILPSIKKKNELFQYMKRALDGAGSELEFVYGSNNYTDPIQRVDFLRILSKLNQQYPTLSETNTLDIIINDIRCSVGGIENIKKYCKTDSTEDIPSATFIRKKKYYDPSFPSLKFNPITDYDYNFRINLKTEEELEESNTDIQSLLLNWKNLLKYFRYKKRYSFITEDHLFRIDLTVIKSNEYDYDKRKNKLFKSFVESGILKNKEEYELEIEYVGSSLLNGEYPVNKFSQKMYREKEKVDEELKKKFEKMKTNWDDKIQEGDNSYSTFSPHEIAPYEDDYNLGVKGIDQDPGEFPEVVIYSKDQVKVTPSYSFEDVTYEYWEDSQREWLFEAILTYGKKIHSLSQKSNSDGDYEGSPKNTTYIEYSIYPEFTEEEREQIDQIDDKFNHIILIPEDQIIKITKFKDPISWAPGKKNKVKREDNELAETTEPSDNYEWKPEKYDFGEPPLIQFEDLKEAGEFDEDIRVQGKVYEYKEKNKKKSNPNDLIEGLVVVFKENIEKIIKLKEDSDIIIKRTDKDRIIVEYRNLTEQSDSNFILKQKNQLKKVKEEDRRGRLVFEIKKLELKTTRFIGPNPVSMSLEHIVPDMKYSITEGYVVTEKADGIRAQLLIGSDRMGYLVTQKMEVIGTKIRFDNCPGNWLFDGEYITQDKNGNPIELFMIFDVYYASDGHSKYPSHAHTYPWISRKKKDICRSSILSEFQSNVEINLDNTEFRIGYKSYLEGPKRMQVSKKDPNKYSNVGGIFKQSKKLWDIETKKSGYRYSIDGLIYMPMYLSVGSMDEGNNKKSFGGEWAINYKWKPPEENTIDFKIRIVTEKTKKGTRDKITSSKINGKVVKCKQVHLYVGYDIKKDEDFDYNWKLLTNDQTKPFKEILFNPEKDNKSFYLCNIPLKNNKLFCEKDKSEIITNQIVEMRYSPENSEDMRWTPLRVRTDKVKPQFFVTANKIWATIINPVTTELITGLDDVYKVKSRLNDNLETGDSPKHAYYAEEGDREGDYITDISLRKLHNYIKNSLISAICSIGNTPISIMDTSIGRGGDISKYLFSKNKIKFLLGLDISPDVNRAAKRFYLETRKKPKAMFIQYDTSESIKDGFGYKGTDKEIERNKSLINIIYHKKKKNPEVFKDIHKNYDKIATNGFNIISSQFTIHYYFKNEMTLRGYLQNLSDNCVKGGYFIGTCYDGKKVFELMKDKEIFEMKDEMENTVFSLKKKYEIESFEYQKNNIKSMFGQEIEVEMSSIGNPFIEYLVNFDMFVDMMKVHRFKLVKPDLKGIYSGIFNKDDFCSGEGLGNFGQIIENLPKLASKDRLLKTTYQAANEINMKKNEKLKELSSLNNWFVFQKY
jgi:hypothetical protein